MMGIFDKLFRRGKNHLKQQEDSTIHQVEDNSSLSKEFTINTESDSEDRLSTYSKVFTLEHNEISITNFNKNISTSYKDHGYEITLNLFKEFWEQNGAEIAFEDGRRLMSALIGILKKERIPSTEIQSILEFRLSNFPEFEEIGYAVNVAKLYKKFDINLALAYIQRVNRKHENSTKNYSDLIESIITESEYLIKFKKYDEAFRNLRRTAIILPNLDQFSYIKYSNKIMDNNAEICFLENNPKYAEYLFYSLSSFLFMLLSEITNFPINPNFFRWKSEYPNSKWPFNDDKRLDKSLEELGILVHKDKIINEINEFGYLTLPTIYGIPAKYDTRDKIDEIYNSVSKNYEEFSNINRLSEKLKLKFVDKEVYEIKKVVKETIAKYCALK